MFREGGPVIEMPLSAAQSLHDMLNQSWGGAIRVFPTVPTTSADVTIDRMRTEGAFEVSAVRQAGITKWVRLTSLAGEPFEVRLGIAGEIKIEYVGALTGELKHLANDRYQLNLNKDKSVLFRAADFLDEPIVTAVQIQTKPEFGLAKLPTLGQPLFVESCGSLQSTTL